MGRVDRSRPWSQPDNGPVRSLLRGARFGTWELVDRDPSAWDFALTLAPAPRRWPSAG